MIHQRKLFGREEVRAESWREARTKQVEMNSPLALRAVSAPGVSVFRLWRKACWSCCAVQALRSDFVILLSALPTLGTISMYTETRKRNLLEMHLTNSGI